MGMRATETTDMDTTESSTKTERIEARVTREQKLFFARAAALAGSSFTDFVIRALQTAAEDTVQRHQVMSMTTRESLAFADAFLNPREPNEPLTRYARRERELFSD